MEATAVKREAPRSILVIGRRWFRRSAGNTYSSAYVYVNGVCVAKIGPVGGYGDYYEQMAQEWLTANGYISPEQYRNGSSECLWRYCERLGITYERNVADVAREKDL